LDRAVGQSRWTEPLERVRIAAVGAAGGGLRLQREPLERAVGAGGAGGARNLVVAPVCVRGGVLLAMAPAPPPAAAPPAAAAAACRRFRRRGLGLLGPGKRAVVESR
jgi:hypothetical protein